MKTNSSKLTLIQASVLAVSLIITLPLRLWQYSYIEPHTGFWKEINTSIIAFYAIGAAAILFFIFSSFFARKSLAFEGSAMKLVGPGILSFTCAVSILFSVYGDLSSMNIDSTPYVVSPTTSFHGIFYVQQLFAVLSALYFLLLGVSFVSGKSSGERYKLLSLTPVIWCVIKLVLRFARTISYVRVSDLMLEMLALAAYASFFMAFAQVNSKVEGKGNEWKLLAAGMPAALLGLICFIPRAVITFMGNSDLIFILSRADVSDFCIALFIIGNVLLRIIPANRNEKVTE